eukprot:175002-Chlamydomonas_euryale.AAC.1
MDLGIGPFACYGFNKFAANATAFGTPRGALAVYEAFQDPAKIARSARIFDLVCGDLIAFGSNCAPEHIYTQPVSYTHLRAHETLMNL